MGDCAITRDGRFMVGTFGTMADFSPGNYIWYTWTWFGNADRTYPYATICCGGCSFCCGPFT